jgi:DNA polymerase-4
MDAFFASVEIRNNPKLHGKPVVVGGGTRGVVAAASYEARRYGVRSAMPMTRALRMCPRAVVVPPNRAAYSAASAQVMAILRDVTALVQPISVDEAFVDVAAAARAQGRPAVIAAGIRRRVADELQLSCSVGIAATKFVAKVASARCKPDGMLVVPKNEVLEFLHPLPVTVLWGVGARTVEPLHRLGIRTVGELAALPADTLRRAVGITDPADVRRELLRLSGDVARRLRDRDFVAHVVGIKIRFADFTTVTRVRTLDTWTDTTAAIYDVAAALYDGLELDRPRIRLVGVKAENLRQPGEVAQQLSFDDISPGSTAVPVADAVVDAARVRFGDGALGYATLLNAPRAEHLSVPDSGADGG